jgi:phospholipase/carboxylesterase
MAPVGKQWFSLQDRNEEAVYKGLSDVTPLLQDYLDKTIKELDLTYADVALLGFSQGSMLSLHFGFRNEETLGGILAFSGALAAADRLKNELKSTPPVCLIHGEDDDVVPFEAFKQATQALQKQNVPLQAYSREELGHGIDPAGLQLGIGFLRELFLAKEAA